jgi:hypothetical protein
MIFYGKNIYCCVCENMLSDNSIPIIFFSPNKMSFASNDNSILNKHDFQ